jgi:hypothetical protein
MNRSGARPAEPLGRSDEAARECCGDNQATTRDRSLVDRPIVIQVSSDCVGPSAGSSPPDDDGMPTAARE